MRNRIVSSRVRIIIAIGEFGALLLLCSLPCPAQITKDPKQLEQGRAMFRIYCAECHGLRGEGGLGPDLTQGTYHHGGRDSDLFHTISHGVSGTEMPAFAADLDPATIWLLVSFIRSTTQGEAAPLPGNRSNGEKLFWGKGGCSECHAVGGHGGQLGPDLTTVGSRRSSAFLRESLVSPSAYLSSGYETVAVVTRDGAKLEGIAKKWDNFTLELMDLSKQTHTFTRSELLSFTRENRSVMPAYGAVFSASEIDDLLAFLSNLRETVSQPEVPTSAAPIDRQLVSAQSDAGTWLMYGRNYAGWRFSPQNQINTHNVAQLRPQWVHQLGVDGRQETTPLVFDQTMWITGPSNHAFALDLRDGREIWHYHSPAPEDLHSCCGQPNRGFAALDGLVFKVNVEGDLLALDSQSGKVVWKTQLADHHKGYSATGAPLTVKNLVVVGIAGAEYGQRGFIDAYEAQTGRRVWRFYTVPRGGEPGSETWAGDSWKNGGGHPWTTGTFDPGLNLIYWGTGNPAPDDNGDVRAGDNLYTCSLLALDADTGKLKWYFQFTPHDTRDWDAIGDPVLIDVQVHGQPVKAVIQADRNGFFYALDRTNGKFLFAKPYTQVTWAKGMSANGRPIPVPGQEPSENGTRICPGAGGGHNWEATAYSPETGLYYFPSSNGCEVFYKIHQEYIEGQMYQASVFVPPRDEASATGSVLAVEPTTGDIKWRFDMVEPPSAGLLATAGGLVFTGDSQGFVFALDARSGKPLWHFQTGGRIASPPITYTFEGKQVLAVASGTDVVTFTLPQVAVGR